MTRLRHMFFIMATACSLGTDDCEHTDYGTTDDTTTDSGTTDSGTPEHDPGALIEVTTEGTVGYLLDEVPAGRERNRIANTLLAANSEVFETLAKKQLDLAYYRLTFRPFFACLFEFDPAVDTPTTYYGYNCPVKGQLPLPPDDVWTIEVSAPYRDRNFDGHDVVLVTYTFSSMLVSTEDSPDRAEPHLRDIGGTWDETIIFPVDPTLLFQRTGYACMDEVDYPPDSPDEENAGFFYDDTCEPGNGASTPEGIEGCHQASALLSCVDAVEDAVGASPTTFHFERVAWDDAVAETFRVHEDATAPGADIIPLAEDATGLVVNRVVYKHFSEGACEIEEGTAVEGWNALLTFDSTSRNIGGQAMVAGVPELLVDAGTNLMEFSECHGHYHFNHYANFGFDVADGAKRSFCLESTNRFANNITTPLDNPYYVCTFQGIETGWGDMYQGNLSGQWVNLTGIIGSSPVVGDLFVDTNPSNLLCEGELVIDGNGQPLFEPTSILDDNGNVISTFQCDELPGSYDNNHAEVEVTVPVRGEGYITSDCPRDEIGPLRDCEMVLEGEFDCTVGEEVEVEITPGPPNTSKTIRVCESSALIGPLACMHRVAVVSQIGTSATFTCPAERDGSGTGGYTLYSGAIAPTF